MVFDKLGNLIKPISERNSEFLYTEVLGISIDKEFMPSVANIIGTDLKKYKIIRKNRFAFNPMHVGRDKRLPIALYKEDEPAILSPAYTTFEVIDDRINIYYLNQILKTDTFDRFCWFHTDSSVRGGLSWEDFCNMIIPIPSIDEQRKIVERYKSIQDRIDLITNLNNVLYDLIDTIYYKEKKEWKEKEEINITKLASIKNGYSYSSDELQESNIGMASIKNFEKNGGFRSTGFKDITPFKKIKSDLYLNKFDIIVAHTDLTPSAEILGNVELILDTSKYDTIIPSMDLVKVTTINENISNKLLYVLIKSSGFKNIAMQHKNGTTVLHLEKEALLNYNIIIPKDIELLKKLEKKVAPIIDLISINTIQTRKLVTLMEKLISLVSMEVQ